MNIIEIVDYDNHKRFSLNLEDYRLTPQKKDWQPAGWPAPGTIGRAEMPRRGFLKRFTFGPNLLCFTLSGYIGPYRVYVNGVEEVLVGDAELNYNTLGAIAYGFLRVGKIKFSFIDIDWVRIFFPNWLSRAIDPTWDDVDEKLSQWEFGEYLMRVSR